ncbi:MAG: hypothetical protein QMB08_07395 [Acidimicrobiales bacterium]
MSAVSIVAVEERAVALASWNGNEPLREIEDNVQVEYERRFVDQNGAPIRCTRRIVAAPTPWATGGHLGAHQGFCP